jgi:hypothetical protein
MGVETYTRNESEVGLPIDTRPVALVVAVQCGPILIACYGVETERTRWYPKDGELCLSRTKPEETLVEVRNGSDVQIDRQTWV